MSPFLTTVYLPWLLFLIAGVLVFFMFIFMPYSSPHSWFCLRSGAVNLSPSVQWVLCHLQTELKILHVLQLSTTFTCILKAIKLSPSHYIFHDIYYRLRNDVWYVEWEVKPYHTIPYHTIPYHSWRIIINHRPLRSGAVQCVVLLDIFEHLHCISPGEIFYRRQDRLKTAITIP